MIIDHPNGGMASFPVVTVFDSRPEARLASGSDVVQWFRLEHHRHPLMHSKNMAETTTVYSSTIVVL